MNNYINDFPFVNLLKQNVGKKTTIYMCFPESTEKDKNFSGIIENCEKDYILLSCPTTGKWNMLFFIFINYIEFDENVNHDLYRVHN